MISLLSKIFHCSSKAIHVLCRQLIEKPFDGFLEFFDVSFVFVGNTATRYIAVALMRVNSCNVKKGSDIRGGVSWLDGREDVNHIVLKEGGWEGSIAVGCMDVLHTAFFVDRYDQVRQHESIHLQRKAQSRRRRGGQMKRSISCVDMYDLRTKLRTPLMKSDKNHLAAQLTQSSPFCKCSS